MRSISIFATVILLVSFVAPAAHAGDADGAAAYAAKCSRCHGNDGRGTAAGQKLGVPALSDDRVQDRSDKFLRTLVAEGRKQMPPFAADLSQDQIIDVVIHVRSFWVPKQAMK